MLGVLFILQMVVVSVAGESTPLPFPLDMENVTNCASTTCLLGTQCRIVYHRKRNAAAPMCLQNENISSKGDPKACGASGHPVLVKKRGQKGQYKLYKNKDVCSELGLPLINDVCCAETEPCHQPQDPGPCEAAIQRYYYNSEENRCQSFTYGGCQGNKNNFESFKECEAICAEVTEKPGRCPITPDEPGICAFTCENDGDCLGDQKCCMTGCNGTTCSPPEAPELTCANVLCSVGTKCIETDAGPDCVRIRPGMCPQIYCPLVLFPMDCKDECIEDNDCQKNFKCCRFCDGCNQCVEAGIPPLCDEVTCPKGEKCVLQDVVCITFPCLPVTACVPIEQKEGQCPTPGPDTEDVCEAQCSDDDECKGDDKCCFGSCGAKTCTRPVPPNSCDDLKCPEGEVCREVYDTEQVSVQCFEKPPEAENGNCSVGMPLLLSSGGDITVTFCGRGPNRVDCPPGYDCNIAPNDAYAFCCPNNALVCYPECEEGDACVTTEVECVRAPCPPVPRCVDLCQLPKVTGPCRGSFQRYYYDSQQHECVQFTYGGCQGNENNFNTIQECKAACAKDVCQLPKDSGPCLAYFARYYYDSELNECSDFIYGGCQGNANNFATIQECKAACTKEKPGQCPKNAGSEICPWESFCVFDRDCPGDEKCCDTGCKVTTCMIPVLTCSDLSCRPGTTCVELKEEGAACVPIKHGQCPKYGCPVPLVLNCKDQCQEDNDCPKNKKCCWTCSGCKECRKSKFTHTCKDVTCGKGEKCVSETVTCITSPCDRLLKCVPEDKKKGQCPTPGPDTERVCDSRCSTDKDCKGNRLCCSTLCGGTKCTSLVPSNTCADVICPKGQTCREVYDLHGVSPQCLEDPPKTPNDGKCSLGHPLLLFDVAGEITVANCGSGRDKIDCTSGYTCQLGPNGAFSFCCSSEVSTCYPECKRGERCETTPIFCITTPCPPTPRCLVDDKCLLPKDQGPCKALIPRYYYDPQTHDCLFFEYGGCKGNDNNFKTAKQCKMECAEHICGLPKEPGLCKAYIPSFYFDQKSQKCKRFIYGGCQGNGNRFSTKKECRKTCKNRISRIDFGVEKIP